MEEDIFNDKSEVVRDYLEKMPHWLLRIGTYLVASIFVALLICLSFIHYPTIVKTDFLLNSKNKPKPVIARTEGTLEKLIAQDHQKVSKNEILGIIESTANYADVLELENELNNIGTLISNRDFERLANEKLKPFEHLGDIHTTYQLFQQNYLQIILLYRDEFYKKKISFLKNDLLELDKSHLNLQEQFKLYERDAELAKKEYAINKKLYEENVIAVLDLDREESKVLSKQLPIKNTDLQIVNNRTLKNSKDREIIEFEKLIQEQREMFIQTFNILRSNVLLWKKTYLIMAPTEGEVSFLRIIQEKEHVKANSELMFIVSKNNSSYFGEIRIPQVNFGKVKVGQQVLIKFQGYPYEEYGVVEGKISNISLLPSSDTNTFFAIADMPLGLVTNNGKVLTYKNGMQASAEIVTEDMTLMDRLFYNLKRIVTDR